MIDRVKKIKEKGFKMDMAPANQEISFNSYQSAPVDFSKIKVGIQTLEDAVLEDLGMYKRINPSMTKEKVLKAINSGNYREMREISNFFFKTSGIYSRLCRYMAYLYRYDWLVTPYINSNKSNNTQLLNDFNKILNRLDNFELKRYFGEVALKVLKEGCYYGYKIENNNNISIQELPSEYCRSRFKVGNNPAVEFNMRYFDTAFKDPYQRERVLKIFGKEFEKAYKLYKLGKLVPDYDGDVSGWYLLDINNTVKFSLNGEDFPVFVTVVPSIIDLDEAKELDRKKMAQELLKIIIQKMPTDKNGDLIFDVDEAKELHNNAVRMLGKAIGIDVLTTFADVDVADMSSSTSRSNSTDELVKVERAIYNEAGASQMLFNTDGNIALEKSIANDEASLYNLITQFESFINNILLKSYNKKPNKIYYRAQILSTTIYNYKELSKMYKEQTQLGYSKMLPQIALGQSQSSILANAYFENDILDLPNVFIPPLMSSTMNADALASRSKNKSESESTGGRPEKEDGEKSEKTLMNEESKN